MFTILQLRTLVGWKPMSFFLEFFLSTKRITRTDRNSNPQSSFIHLLRDDMRTFPIVLKFGEITSPRFSIEYPYCVSRLVITVGALTTSLLHPVAGYRIYVITSVLPILQLSIVDRSGLSSRSLKWSLQKPREKLFQNRIRNIGIGCSG